MNNNIEIAQTVWLFEKDNKVVGYCVRCRKITTIEKLSGLVKKYEEKENINDLTIGNMYNKLRRKVCRDCILKEIEDSREKEVLSDLDDDIDEVPKDKDKYESEEEN